MAPTLFGQIVSAIDSGDIPKVETLLEVIFEAGRGYWYDHTNPLATEREVFKSCLVESFFAYKLSELAVAKHNAKLTILLNGITKFIPTAKTDIDYAKAVLPALDKDEQYVVSRFWDLPTTVTPNHRETLEELLTNQPSTRKDGYYVGLAIDFGSTEFLKGIPDMYLPIAYQSKVDKTTNAYFRMAMDSHVPLKEILETYTPIEKGITINLDDINPSDRADYLKLIREKCLFVEGVVDLQDLIDLKGNTNTETFINQLSTIEFTQRAFDWLMSSHFTMKDRATLMGKLVYEMWTHDPKMFKLRKQYHEVIEEVIKTGDVIMERMIDTYMPCRWFETDLLEVYHSTKNKAPFVGLAIVSNDLNVYEEVFRAYKGSGKAMYNHMYTLFTDPLLSSKLDYLNHFGSFIKYMSTLEDTNREVGTPLVPTLFLLPELQSFHRG
jgi:hypothetical protein